MVYGWPAVADGTVYVGGADPPVYALDAATGDEQWTADVDAGSSTTVADDTVYVVDSVLVALDATDGSELWTTGGREDSRVSGIRTRPTVAEDGTIYVGTGYSEVHGIDPSDGAKRWTFETGDEVNSTPTVDGDAVYVGSDDHHLYALAVA